MMKWQTAILCLGLWVLPAWSGEADVEESGSTLQDAYSSMRRRTAPERAKSRTLLRASASPETGKVLASLCLACHNINANEPSRGVSPRLVYVGPSLFGVVGRNIASREDFTYTEALRKLRGERWTEKNLSKFLKNPARYSPGLAMKFEGVLDPQDRRDIIAFLKTLK